MGGKIGNGSLTPGGEYSSLEGPRSGANITGFEHKGGKVYITTEAGRRIEIPKFKAGDSDSPPPSIEDLVAEEDNNYAYIEYTPGNFGVVNRAGEAVDGASRAQNAALNITSASDEAVSQLHVADFNSDCPEGISKNVLAKELARMLNLSDGKSIAFKRDGGKDYRIYTMDSANNLTSTKSKERPTASFNVTFNSSQAMTSGSKVDVAVTIHTLGVNKPEPKFFTVSKTGAQESDIGVVVTDAAGPAEPTYASADALVVGDDSGAGEVLYDAAAAGPPTTTVFDGHVYAHGDAYVYGGNDSGNASDGSVTYDSASGNASGDKEHSGDPTYAVAHATRGAKHSNTYDMAAADGGSDVDPTVLGEDATTEVFTAKKGGNVPGGKPVGN